MDPDACLAAICDPEATPNDRAIAAENLADWLRAGGFPPRLPTSRVRRCRACMEAYAGAVQAAVHAGHGPQDRLADDVKTWVPDD
jgi:hypothetical protein